MVLAQRPMSISPPGDPNDPTGELYWRKLLVQAEVIPASSVEGVAKKFVHVIRHEQFLTTPTFPAGGRHA